MIKRYAETKLCRHGLMTYNTNDLYVGRSFQLYGEFSGIEVDWLLGQLAEDSHVVDVGANIGALTVLFATRCHKGRVFAIEPQVFAFHMLCANIVTNSLIHAMPINCAAGSECKTISVPCMDPLRTNNFGGLDIRVDAPGMPVQMITVDSLGLQKCDLIKIDVEGMEPDVLRGAVKTIEKFRPLLYVEADRPDSREETIELIESFGYDMEPHEPPLFSPNNYAGRMENVFANIVSMNLMCRPRN